MHRKVDWDSIEDVKEYAILINGCEGGMRVSEYIGDIDGIITEKTIFNENVVYGKGTYTHEVATATIKFRKTKTDRIGGKEKVGLKCVCDGFNSEPCAIHAGLKWMELRRKYYPKKCGRKQAPYFTIDILQIEMELQ